MFVTIVAMTLIVAALLGSCDKLDLAQNTSASPESNSGTQTWAASALKTPTRPPSTNTPTPSPTPTETPTVTPTQTPSPTPTPEIPFLIAQFGLNPERQYTFVITENGTRYLRDEHNQALMLKYIVAEEAGQTIGAWVDTSLEEKYGHLVPVDQRLLTLRFSGFDYYDCVNKRADENYSNLMMVVWSTGNVRTETWFDLNINKEVSALIGTAVYRDQRGDLQNLEVQYKLVDTSNPEFNIGACIYNSQEEVDRDNDFCPLSGGFRPTLGVIENILKQPGQMVRVVITDQRPDTPSTECALPNNTGDTNINSIGTFYMFDRDLWPEMTESISQTGINPHPNTVVGATAFVIYFSRDEFDSIYGFYPLENP